MNARMTSGCLTVALLGVVWSASATAADWPRFRGENGSGVAADTGLPTTWSNKENIVWRTSLPGYGASSPVTWKDRIYITAFSGYGTKGDADTQKKSELKLHIVCFNRADGSVRWDETIPGNPDENNYRGFVQLHGYSSGSPAVDDSGVYAFFGSSGVVGYSLDGKQLWKKSVGTKTHQFGTGASPIIYRDLLIVNASVESNSLRAFDKKSGDEVWKAPGINQAWNTPVLVETADSKNELVLNAGGTLRAFNPESGTELWKYSSGTSDYICPSPIAGKGIVYAVCGRRGPAVAVRAGGSGDVTKTHEVWKTDGKISSNVPSPVLVDGKLYVVNDKGIANCLDAATGETLKTQRLESSDKVYASPVAVDGKLYAVSREHGTYVLAGDKSLELLAHNAIAGDESIFNATPVVSNGQLLLRSDAFLYCIGQ